MNCTNFYELFFHADSTDLSRCTQILFYRKARKVFVSAWFCKNTKFAKLFQYKALRTLNLLKILLYKNFDLNQLVFGKINVQIINKNLWQNNAKN